MGARGGEAPPVIFSARCKRCQVSCLFQLREESAGGQSPGRQRGADRAPGAFFILSRRSRFATTSAPTAMSTASGDAHEGAEAPTLLDTLARVPAVVALVMAALDYEGRRALRLVHPQLRDAVGEAATKLCTDCMEDGERTPTSLRWPRLEELFIARPTLTALEALGSETWGNLHTLIVTNEQEMPDGTRISCRLDVPSARALAALLRRMPALRNLKLEDVLLPRTAAAALFRGSRETAPRLRSFSAQLSYLTPRGARALAASGWRLEELDLNGSSLGAAGVAALLAAPTFAIRRLVLASCELDTASLLALASAPWPLEELDLSFNDFSAAAAGPALVALSRHRCLRELSIGDCGLTAAGFNALVEATWPKLTSLLAFTWTPANYGPLGAAAFAGFPALEELWLWGVELGEAGARLLASRRWPRLRKLDLHDTKLGAAGVASLARGEWPSLQWLSLRDNRLPAPLALEEARRWAPALEELITIPL